MSDSSLATMSEQNEGGSAVITGTNLLEKMRLFKREAALELASPKDETFPKPINQTGESDKSPSAARVIKNISVKNQVELYLPNGYDYAAIEFDSARYQDERLRLRPMYHEWGFTENSKVYGRKGVFKRLVAALKDRLPKEYGIQIWDAYRPIAVQRKLYESRLVEVILESLPKERQTTSIKDQIKNDVKKYMSEPSEMTLEEIINNSKSPWQKDQILDETKKYVSEPSKAKDAQKCSPHLSGGAIDLTLYDTKTGKELNMGTDFDEFKKFAHSEYFEFKDEKDLTEKMKEIRKEIRDHKPKQNHDNKPKNIHECFKAEHGEDLNDEDFKKRMIEIRDNRRILRNALTAAGFSSYEHEWWHFDLGDKFWGKFWEKYPELMVKAEYGPLFQDKEYPTLRCYSFIFFANCTDINPPLEIFSIHDRILHEKLDNIFGGPENEALA
jgi:D-alanyl-D-alanine dipeptidase